VDTFIETILGLLCLNCISWFVGAIVEAPEDTDHQLVKECVRGNRRAFDQLVEKYYKRIYNLAYRFVNDPEEANDLAQEIFTAAYQNIKRFRGDAKFSTWLFQIASNRGKNRFKYLKRRGLLGNRASGEGDEDREQSDNSIPDNSGNPEDLLASAQIQKLVQDAIDGLDPDHKEIVILRDIEGFSYDEIAQMLGLPEGTTKSRLHRARMIVKEKLKKVLS
jgi:RNA polymerase sigma-70 factor, ECF subfamily